MYLGSTLLGVRAGAEELWTDASSDVGAAVSPLARMLRSGKGQRPRGVRVWLSAGLARAFVVPAECGARNESEALAIAETMASGSTGLTGELNVWTDAWRAKSGCVAAAMPAALLASLRKDCALLEIRLTSVKPWWNLAANSALSEASSAGHREVLWSLSEPDGMTLGTLESGVIQSIDTIEPLPHDPNWEQLRIRAAVGRSGDMTYWHATAEPKSQTPPALPIGSWKVNTNINSVAARAGATEVAAGAS